MSGAGKGVDAALAAHNAVRRFELDDAEHALVMLITDVLDWCNDQGIDFDLVVERARETFADCQS